MKHKILMTLALLLTAVGGAWAQDAYEEITTQTSGTKEYTGEHIKIVGTLICENGLRMASSGDNKVTISTLNGKVIKRVEMHIVNAYNWKNTNKVVSTSGNEAEGTYQDGNTIILSNENASEITLSVTNPYACSIDINTWKVYYGDPAIDVKWDAATKTGTFTMPAYDVEIAPVYAPTAQWAKDKEVDQIPAAIEGIYAGTDDIIVAPGTVANMGNTEDPQGIVMYAVTSTNQTTAPALTAFSDALPTAKDIADEGATVLIWYYIHGFGDPAAEGASAENTFNDSEICTTPIQVTVLSNKFDIQFNAANANTIEAGKATVTVGGTAAEVKEGKLEGVKMNSKVTVTAKEGYKFRKAEGKKNDGSTSLDESTVGMIVCTNGKAYPVNMKDNLPSGVTAVGIVAYKNGKNGLVMALTDEATNMNWSTATGDNGAKAHTPAVEGYSWKVPTINEWQYNIFTNAGVGNLAGLSAYMTAAGGTGLQNGCYWTSTPKPNEYYARCIEIQNGSINFNPSGNTTLKSNGYHVRAVFAF